MSDSNEKSAEIGGEQYRLIVEQLKVGMQVQADYGKWLIATLTLLHSSAARFPRLK